MVNDIFRRSGTADKHGCFIEASVVRVIEHSEQEKKKRIRKSESERLQTELAGLLSAKNYQVFKNPR